MTGKLHQACPLSCFLSSFSFLGPETEKWVWNIVLGQKITVCSEKVAEAPDKDARASLKELPRTKPVIN